MTRKAYFNGAAKDWDERFYTPELAIFLENLVPNFGLETGQDVLDVGTGTGILIPFLLQPSVPPDLSQPSIMLKRWFRSVDQNTLISKTYQSSFKM